RPRLHRVREVTKCVTPEVASDGNRHAEPRLLPTSVVGSFPPPYWLIDRSHLASRLPPRIRALELWRVESEFLEQAQDDATRLAITDMERAGIDIVTDGEQR